MNRKRYAGLDCLRGINLISMMLYHGIWDLVYIFGMDWQWFRSGFAYLWQQSICWLFILLSGFCWHFGARKWKRGLIVFGSGAVITVVTKLFMPDSVIIFGVLTLLGSCMLLMIVLDKWFMRWNKIAGVMISFMLFLVTRNVNYGYLGFERWNLLRLPEMLYVNDFTTYLGFMKPGFFSSDYFSVIPWIFLFMTGYFLYDIVIEHKWLDKIEVGKCRWLEWMGCHSLLVYILHQPVVFGVLYAACEMLMKNRNQIL